MKLRFYLDTRNKGRGEEAPLKLSIRNNNTSALLSLGISLLPSHWDAKNEKVIVHPRKDFYNRFISSRRLDVQELVLGLMANGQLSGMSASDIKRYIEKEMSKDAEEEEKGLFYHCFVRFMESKTNLRTKEIYKYTLTMIERFQENADLLDFKDINKEWLTSFDNYLAKTSPSKNARNIHLRNIRAVFNAAIDDELTNCYPFRKFKIKGEKTAKRALTVEELRTLFNYPVEEYLQQYIDMFKLIFFLIGINTIDLLQANKNELIKGRLQYKRAKTGRLYDIKVEPEAMFLINRYKGDNYLLNILDRYSYYKDYVKRMNMNLQRIGEVTRVGRGGKKIIKPLFPQITTYWARHSWATIAASLDIPKETIAAALGHGGNTVTDIYIDFDQKKVDEANRRVIDWVLYGKR